MADIFISYVEEDADVALALAGGLTQAGYSCWYYQRSSLPGPSYLLQITEAIAQAQVVLLVLSPRTLESHQVDKEIHYAHECAKPFLPITRNLAWGEFQQRRPTWRMAIGTATAIAVPPEGASAILADIVRGLQAFRLSPVAAPLAGVTPAPAQVPPSATTPILPVRAPIVTDRCALPGSLRTRAALVGRARELENLEAEYDGVAAGSGGRLVFISGEPGVGKTRLAQEVGLYAWGRGGVLLEGRYLREGTAPFGPWVDALYPALRSLPAEALAPLAAGYGAELVQLFPGLAARIGAAPAPAALPPEEQRRRLLDALVESVSELARPQPLVLILNDVQWAPGLGTLTHLARRLGEARVLVIGTYREQEFQAQPVLRREWLELNRERLALQVILHPLAEADSERLIAQYFGAEPARQLREVVYQRTRGNAFFLEEVLRSLVETGAVREVGGGWEVADAAQITVPDSVKAVVEERVERLGEGAREVLMHAAVLGQEFSFAVLQALTGRSEDDLLEVVEQALTARLLTDRSVSGEERYAFADDQVQEVLYASILAPRRRRLHLRAGQALEQIYAGRLERHLEDLAHHFRTDNDPTKGLEYSLAAGERAFSLSVWERAVRHFETALELLSQLPEDLAGQARVHERLADLHNLLAQLGIEHAERALELYTKVGDKRKAARMHRLVGRFWTTGTAGESDFVKNLVHMEAAVELLAGEPDSPEKADAYCGSVGALINGALRLDQALDHGRQALVIAERLDDPNQSANALTTLALALAFRGELAAAEQCAERSREIAAGSVIPFIRGAAALWPLTTWPWRQDRAWTERWLDRYREFRQRTNIELFEQGALGLSALFFARSGRPAEVVEALRHAIEFRSRYPYLHRPMLHFAGAVQEVVGNWEEARHLFAAAFTASERSHGLGRLAESATFYGRFLLKRGAAVEAEAVLTRAYEVVRGTGSAVQELNLLPLLAEVATEKGRLDEAEQSLRRARELLARPEEWRGLTARVHRAEGVLAAARSDFVVAERAFDKALEAERSYGFLYDEALHLVPWAELYFQRGEPGDRERGLEKLDQALAIFAQCEAKKDIERVLAQRVAVAS
ncbi:MAG: AAA family ATPase [Chloroflexi bacterium]|nr:AAA family ATPase [Chloroflexota bacterium]